MKKITIILIISILLVSLRVDYVKADTLTENWTRTFALARDNVLALQDMVNQSLGVKTEKTKTAINSLLAPLGFIVGAITISEQNFHDIFNMKSYGGVYIGGENATNEQVVDDVIDYIINNISFEGNQITFGGDIKNLLNDYATYIKNIEPWHYMYSYDISQTTNNWNNGIAYNRVRDIIRDHQQNYYVLYTSTDVNINNAKFVFWFIPKNDDVQFVYNEGVYPKQLNIANYHTWEWIWAYGGYSTVSQNVYIFDGSTLSPSNEQVEIGFNSCLLQEEPTNSTINQNGVYTNWALVSTSVYKDQVLVWDSLNAMKNGSVGNRGYYVSDSYNNNITDSNNVYDSSNSNNVSYGDVTNYINNYYGSNGEYPTQPTINIYINNNIPSGSGGGGSGGGSGGSSGGSGEGSSIWDFLSRLGEVLGGLISNLGNMLTSLIDSIISIINDVVGKIPNIFNGLLNIVFGGLPEDLRAVIILGITVMVVYGIIKVIRG